MAYAAWIFLLISVFIYFGREVITLSIKKHTYFLKWEAYRNMIIMFSIILVVYQGPPIQDGLMIQRWQYHVAGYTCLLLWLEMLMLVGKIPKFGKYIHMFK